MMPNLSPAELDVLHELVAGPDRTDAGIAERLFVSENTVKTHMRRLLTKTGAGNRTRLAVWGLRELEMT